MKNVQNKFMNTFKLLVLLTFIISHHVDIHSSPYLEPSNKTMWDTKYLSAGNAWPVSHHWLWLWSGD